MAALVERRQTAHYRKPAGREQTTKTSLKEHKNVLLKSTNKNTDLFHHIQLPDTAIVSIMSIGVDFGG